MASSGSRMLTAGVADDVRSNCRASSLIRMWRELEAEAGGGLVSNHCAETAVDAVASDGSGWLDGLGDWTSDAMTTASSEPASSFPSPSSSEIDQNRVGDITRAPSTCCGSQGFMATAAPINNENKAGRLRAGESSWVLSPRRLRMEQERRRELAALAYRCSVSRFAHRGRLQSMIKLRSLERQAAVLDLTRYFPSRMDSDRPHNQSTISFLSGRNPILEVQSREIWMNTSRAEDVLLPIDTECSGSACSTEQFDGSSAGRCSWASNSCQRRPPASSSQSIGRHSEGADQEIEEPYPQQNVCGQVRRRWRVARRHDSFENFADNVEIRELLDRRRVSTSLASDFCDKMNRLILSFAQRQRARNCFFDEDTVNHHPWEPSAEHQNLEQVDSVSSSLEREAVHELRSEMARIHEEIRELRQMVESCMEWQGRLEQTIKQDILDAVHQSVGSMKSLQNLSL